jgi:hypothetical protein
MRRTNSRGRRETGMPAALKAASVVLAVGVLALVAGQAAYRSDAGPVAAPKYQMIDPAPDDAPYVGADMQAASPVEKVEPHLLAVAPKDMSLPEVQMQESARPKSVTAPDEEPVATF